MPTILTVTPGKTGEGNGNPLPYSCLGNPMDGGASQAAGQGSQGVRRDSVTKQQQGR